MTTPPQNRVVDSTSSSQIGPGGGSVSTTLHGTTATATVPAGALAATTTFSITLYAPGAAPEALASVRKTAAGGGTPPLPIPSGASAVAAISINANGATLLKAVQLSVTTSAAASGSVFRLAGYGLYGFGDVDTATYAAGTVTEDDNSAYPGASLAAKTLYEFYTVPQTSADGPPNPATFAISVSGPATVAALGTAQYAGLETDGNGFPLLQATFTYTATPAIGSIAAGGAFTAGPSDGTGTVTASDAVHPSIAAGTLAVAVTTSVRPSGGGDVFTLKGTMTIAYTLNEIASQPNATPGPVSSSSTANVTQTITSAGSTDGINYTLATNEADAYPLQTITSTGSTTLAYNATGSGGYVERLTGTSATDSNGVVYSTTYGASNGALTAIPETAQTLTDNAVLTYNETDPGDQAYDQNGNPINAPTTVRTQNADGSYTATTWDDEGFQNAYQDSSDGSGSATILFNGTPVTVAFEPVTTSTSPASVPVGIFEGGQLVDSFSAPAWYGTTVPALSTEQVTITPSTALPNGCTAYAGATGTPTLVQDQLTSYDMGIGQTETRTTSSYDLPGPGTVCIVLSDTIQTYYDFSGQDGNYLIATGGNTGALETSTETETLSLSSATTASSVARSGASTKRSTTAATGLPIAFVAATRARFDHIVAKARVDALRRITREKRSSSGKVR